MIRGWAERRNSDGESRDARHCEVPVARIGMTAVAIPLVRDFVRHRQKAVLAGSVDLEDTPEVPAPLRAVPKGGCPG